MFVQYSFVQEQQRNRVGAPAIELTPGISIAFGIVAMLLTTIGYTLA